ncbi:GNAT family N-acetyltransferase [bacterium]|nr:GNAT family N-acetyltransferase [bacterium]NDC93907.1 GNAT family N-acetyltransferase [bacterium]NDD83259.1 GNAT family N-acetyltransferase [bacterium]NDG28885.1 GNAT family N-acetyltransferase [bacterium]
MLVPFGFTVDTSHCELAKFSSDAGLVYPLVYNSSGLSIVTFQSVSEDVKLWVAERLLEVWSKEAEISSITDAVNYISTHFRYGDIFYVLFVHAEPIGFMGMDTKNWIPFLSHLYIDNRYRNKGYAKLLLDFGRKWATHRQFSEYKLFCKPELVYFYRKRGFEEIDNNGPYVIMKTNDCV